MDNYKSIDPAELGESVITLIGKEWLLVSAGDKHSYNTMTASWGTVGFFSNQPVVTVFIRPERYTYEFIEREERFTLTVLDADARSAHSILGKKSGRDGDKIAEAGLTTIFTEGGNPTFAEGRVVLECRKIFAQDMTRESFVDQECYNKWYGAGHGNPHRIYMAIIEGCWIKM